MKDGLYHDIINLNKLKVCYIMGCILDTFMYAFVSRLLVYYFLCVKILNNLFYINCSSLNSDFKFDLNCFHNCLIET